MITAPALSLLANAMGEPYSSLERMTRPLKPDLWPSPGLGQGRKKDAPGITNRNLSSFLLGVPARLPHEAREVSESLGAAVFDPPQGIERTFVAQLEEGSPPIPCAPGARLDDFLAEVIDILANNPQSDAATRVKAEHWSINLCNKPPTAFVTWDEYRSGLGSIAGKMRFSVPLDMFSGSPGITRFTMISSAVILTAADIWRDTLSRRGDSLPLSSSGSGGAVPNASQGSGDENAGQNPPQGSKPASPGRTRKKGGAATPSIPKAQGLTHPQSNPRDRAAAMPAAQEGRQQTRILSLLAMPHLSKVNPANDCYPEPHHRQHADRCR